MAAAAAGAPKEVVLSDADYEWVRKRIKDVSGIDLGDGKRHLVQGRMARRLRSLQLGSFREYRNLLDGGGAGPELTEFVNALTTNVTSFFRENHHFERLRGEVVDWARSRGRKLRGWSAGCSSGEEPYTIAMTLLEGFGEARGGWDARILATDLDTNVIETAAAAVYPMERVEGVPPPILNRYFHRGKGARAGFARIKPTVTELVRFRQLNLMESWPMKGPFDFIFCRNVMIYFDQPTRQKLVRRFAGLLAPGGYLFIGHSESIEGAVDVLESVGQTTYRRRA